MSLNRPLSAVAVVAMCASIATADVLYVDDDAPPGGDGASWATAWRFVRDALEYAADPLNQIDEIRVGQGVQRPDLFVTDPPSDCCEAHVPGGCDDPACEELICSFVPDCCEVAWDDLCVQMAEAACNGLCDEVPIDPDWTFELPDGVALIGGYAGVGAPDPDARDPQVYVTSLDANMGDQEASHDDCRKIVTMSGVGASTVLDGFVIANSHSPSGGGILLADGASPTVRSCVVENHGYPHTFVGTGAGVLIEGGSPSFSNCIFRQNESASGGAVFNDRGNATFEDCLFENNLTKGTGGAIGNNHATATFVGCTFSGNIVEDPIAEYFESYGGAVFSRSSTLSFVKCTFEQNRLLEDGYPRGGAIANISNTSAEIIDCTFRQNQAWGGAAIFSTEESTTVLDGCLFEDNVADGWGGGIECHEDAGMTLNNCTFTGNLAANDGGAVRIAYTNPFDVIGCVFDDNHAGSDGGAIQCGFSTHLTIVDSVLSNNSANLGGAIGGDRPSWVLAIRCLFDGNAAIGSETYSRGGAITVFNALTVIESVFVGNSSVYKGGAVHAFWFSGPQTFVNCLLAGNSAGVDGGAVCNLSDEPASLVNCTLAGNVAGGQGGGLLDDPECEGSVFFNSILWLNSDSGGMDETAQIDSATATVNYSCVQGWTGTMAGAGTIGEDPLFVDAANGNFRLTAGSPAIDAGHNWVIAGLAGTDLDGNPRFAADEADFDPGCGVPVVVDMGAYEYQGEPFSVKFGDLDGDGTVGVNDFLLLIDGWGLCPEGCCLADLDFEGSVGAVDFLLLLANWGP